MNKIYLVDGSSYIFRAFWAINANLSNNDGLPTNALYGFTSMIRKLLEDENPTHISVVLDPFKKESVNFRKILYPSYKANRPEMPEGLVAQIPYFTKILDALNIHHQSLDNHEADDVIATITKKARENNDLVTIVSSDKDLLQLLEDGHVSMIDTMKGQCFTVDDVIKKFGVPPEKVRFVQALAGDSSDNVPGVPGIGNKIGGQLIQQFGDLESLLSNIPKVSGTKRKQNLTEFADQARLSLQLVTLKDCCDIPYRPDDYIVEPPDLAQLTDLFDFLDFKQPLFAIRSWMKSRGWPTELNQNLQGDLFSHNTQNKAQSSRDSDDSVDTKPLETVHVEKKYNAITDLDSLHSAFQSINQSLTDGQLVAFDLETTSLNPLEAKIVGLSFSWENNQGIYIPIAHNDITLPQLTFEQVFELLKPLLVAQKEYFVVQNGKFEWSVLRQFDIEFNSIKWDTMLMSYVLDPEPPDRSHSLDTMAMRYFGHQMVTFEDVAGKGKSQLTFDNVDILTATNYAAEDADYTRLIAQRLEPLLQNEPTLLKLYREIEAPLETVLARMECCGITVDRSILNNLSHEFEIEINHLQQEINDSADQELNPNSPKQLQGVLFDKLELPVKKRTKTGPSTDASVLEELAAIHPLPQLILDYRSVSKLKSTYVDALPELIQKDGRIHSDFNQTVVSTGRLSSSNPNLQNIPVRSEQGQTIREAFIPQKGWTLLCADYSQIELRIMAHMSEDPKLVEAYKKGEDIHTLTASEIFELPKDEVSAQQRRAAKTINFGIMYGMGPKLLATRLKISLGEAKDYIERYFERYNGVTSFFDTLVERAKEKGYAETMFGRRRPLPDINGRGRMAAFSERAAVNTPIQGTSADIIKVAMVRLDAKIREEMLPINILLQVHDELVLEVDTEYADAAKRLVKSIMETVVVLHIPLIVDINCGNNWLDAK